MKAARRWKLAWTFGLLCAAATSSAGENFRLELGVYVFKEAPPAAAATAAERAKILRAPAVLELQGEKLTLEGAEFTWSGGRNPPVGFTQIQLPTVITPAGQPVRLHSAAPVQYLERIDGHRFEVRTIAKESPEAPHCRIELQVDPTGAGEAGIRVSCTVSLATVASREKIEGVDLDVGRPLLARFEEHVVMTVRLQEWTALLLRHPNASPFSLLVLVKAAPHPVAADRAAGQSLSAGELASFLTFYYQSPAPDRIAQAIASLGPSRLLERGTFAAWQYQQPEYTCLGFFSEVFARHPDRVPQWRESLRNNQDPNASYWLRKAFGAKWTGARLEVPAMEYPRQEVHFLWGAFTASGNPAYLRAIIDRLALVDLVRSEPFEAGAQAMLLLANNGPAHPLIRETLQQASPNVSARTRELIDDLLTKDFAAVRRQIEALDKRRPADRFPYPAM